MQIQWFGTASVGVTHGAVRLLFDPFVPLKGSPVPVTIDDYDGYPHIFVTHGHFDHIASIPAIVRRNPEAQIHCTRAPFKALLSKGVPEKNLDLIAPGREFAFGGLALRVFRGRHAALGGLTPERLRALLKSPFKGNLPYTLYFKGTPDMPGNGRDGLLPHRSRRQIPLSHGKPQPPGG